MADVNIQTKNILEEGDTTNPTQVFNKDKNKAVEKPLSLEDRTQQAIDQGIYSPDLRNRFIGEITATLFGDPTGGLKYPNGNDEDRAFEKQRLEGLPLEGLFDEYQYWNEQAQNVWNLDDDAEMNVKDWFSKMSERLGFQKKPEGKETELLKGSDYFPPKP